LRQTIYLKRLTGGRSRAFSLAELLVASLLASILLLGLAATIYLPIKAMRQATDIDTAQSRAEMIFSILRNPLEQCGYGLPKSVSDYGASFKSSVPPFNWPGALSIGDASYSTGPKGNGRCRITYAVRSKIRTLSQSGTSSDRLEVRTTGVPSKLAGESDEDYKENNVANWIVLGAMMPYCLPARQYTKPTQLDDGSVVLRFILNKQSDDNIFVPENDELFYLRAMECMVMKTEDDSIFATKDHSGSGWQPRVDGVVDIRFEMEEDGKLLRVFTLTRGNNRYPRIVTRGAPSGWPERYALSIPEEARHYRLIAGSASFSMKNL